MANELPARPLLLFGQVQRPLHRDWPLHAEVVIIGGREYGASHRDFCLFSVEATADRLAEHTHGIFKDWAKDVFRGTPADAIERRWHEEVARVLTEARALPGFPETRQQLDRLWTCWQDRGAGTNGTAKRMTNRVLGLDPRRPTLAERTPMVRYIHPDEPSFLDVVPDGPRVLHGVLDLGLGPNVTETADAPFFSQAGARQRLEYHYAIGLVSDAEHERHEQAIATGPLVPGDELTRADRVAVAYVKGYDKVYAYYLAHALGAPVRQGPRVVAHERRQTATVYLWDDHILLRSSMKTLDDTQKYLDDTVRDGLILLEERDFLMDEMRKTNVPQSVPHPGPAFADC